jgi:hypothetical protein
MFPFLSKRDLGGVQPLFRAIEQQPQLSQGPPPQPDFQSVFHGFHPFACVSINSAAVIAVFKVSSDDISIRLIGLALPINHPDQKASISSPTGAVGTAPVN